MHFHNESNIKFYKTTSFQSLFRLFKINRFLVIFLPTDSSSTSSFAFLLPLLYFNVYPYKFYFSCSDPENVSTKFFSLKV